MRDACGVPVGVSTGAWIEPDVDRRIALVRAWRAPDYASVNVCEPGAARIMEALLAAGVGIEAGVWTVEDADRLAATGLAHEITRVLIEPVEVPDGEAITLVDAIHEALDDHAITVPRLQHGDGEATWTLVADAVRRGIDTRIGLEDTLHEPDGTRTSGNAALVRAARALGAGARGVGVALAAQPASGGVARRGELGRDVVLEPRVEHEQHLVAGLDDGVGLGHEAARRRAASR